MANAPYFDVTDATHLALLSPNVRSNAELANIAPLAEAAVIGYYTDNPPYFLYTAYDAYVHERHGGPGPWLLGFAERGAGTDISATTVGAAQLRVYLTGYQADAASSAVDPNLKVALRMTIAQVIRWWAVGWGREPGITSSSDAAGKARAYRENAEDVFPPSWNTLLIAFDSRPRPWAL